LSGDLPKILLKISNNSENINRKKEIKKPSALQKAFCRCHQILNMQVCLHSFFFLVSAFFSVFIFLFGAEDESKAANAIAVTPEARMRATMIFFIAFLFSYQKLRQFFGVG